MLLGSCLHSTRKVTRVDLLLALICFNFLNITNIRVHVLSVTFKLFSIATSLHHLPSVFTQNLCACLINRNNTYTRTNRNIFYVSIICITVWLISLNIVLKIHTWGHNASFKPQQINTCYRCFYLLFTFHLALAENAKLFVREQWLIGSAISEMSRFASKNCNFLKMEFFWTFVAVRNKWNCI